MNPSRFFLILRQGAPARWLVLGLALCASQLRAATPTGVEILWDKFGVPHIYAQDVDGLFFAYGYAQMQSHGNLILKLYAESRGRASEYWGEKSATPPAFGGATYLANDRWVHLNEMPERAQLWYEQQTPVFRGHLDAFAAGMNEYARRHPGALDPERRRALPITGVDPILHTHRIVHFTYVASLARVASAAAGRSSAADGPGSNAWAIAPKRSASGHTLMLLNPHLPWGDWYTYYEAHLNAPGISLYGSSQIGFPVLRFAFDERHGFTHTVNSLDASDLYRLTPQGDGYLFDGAVKPFERREKTFKVRQPDGALRDETLLIRRSVHGPVVWDENGVMLAQRTAGLDKPFMLEQYWQMALAKDFAAYEAQVKRLQVPTFNIVYADREGHVMYLFNGAVPKRPKGDAAFWAGAVPGDTSETLWTETHAYEELPKVIDPDAGFVQSTNDPPWTATYPVVLEPEKFPAYLASRDYTFRTERSLRMLTEDTSITYDELLAYKLSTRLELADRVVDDLAAAAAAHGTELAKKAAAVLLAWDRTTESGSRGALLFEGWAMKFMGPGLTSKAGFAVPLDYRQPFTTPRGFKDPAAAARMLDEAAQDALKRYAALDAPYGDFRRFQIGGTDLPGNGASGSLGAFRVARFGAAPGVARQSAVFGDTFVAALEFAPEGVRARVLTSYGNSSQPGSPHHEDQLALLSAKQLRTPALSRAEVEADVASVDRF